MELIRLAQQYDEYLEDGVALSDATREQLEAAVLAGQAAEAGGVDEDGNPRWWLAAIGSGQHPWEADTGKAAADSGGCTCCQVHSYAVVDDEQLDDECPRCGHLLRAHHGA